MNDHKNATPNEDIDDPGYGAAKANAPTRVNSDVLIMPPSASIADDPNFPIESFDVTSFRDLFKFIESHPGNKVAALSISAKVLSDIAKVVDEVPLNLSLLVGVPNADYDVAFMQSVLHYPVVSYAAITDRWNKAPIEKKLEDKAAAKPSENFMATMEQPDFRNPKEPEVTNIQRS